MNRTAEQERILASLHGALRIAAGAGTGKTDTLRLAVVELIGRGVRPGQILCLTFTVEATQEMRRRVLREFGDREDIDPDELTVQTYHAFAASILREHALLAALDGDPVLLDQARKWQLLLEALESCSFPTLEIGWLPSFLSHLLDLDDELSRHVLSTAGVADWCRRDGGDVALQRLDALGALDAYAALKRERNAIDFGDQVALAVRLLRERQEVLERLRARYRYVFLDEYQDTDVAQRELMRLIATGADLVCAVGDVDQGIFGWRGATIHNMFAFSEDFPGARTKPLSTNFRSGKPILDLANAIIEPFEPPEGYEREPLRAWDGAPPAEIEAFVAPHTLEEAEGIAERIAAGGEPWSRYAALVRKRSQMDAIFRALAERGVPVDVDTLGGFWTRPEILDVQAWLHLLADPGDNIALARLLLGPAYRLSRRDLFFLADYAKGKNRERRRLRYGDRDVLPYSIVDAVVAHEELPSLSEEARARIAAFRATWRELAAVAERSSLADLVGEVARVSGLASELAASRDAEAEVALRHVAKLRDLAQAYEPVAGSADLGGFVAYLDSIEESEQDEDALRAVEENAVRLMTIFRGKGLEWDTVFLPGLSDSVMPSAPRGGNNPQKCWFRVPFELRGDRDFLPTETDDGIAALKADEERRLMYVGITRAKTRLVLSRAWFYWDNKGPKPPSPFWDEALETGLVRVTGDCECPEENPHPVLEQPAAPGAGLGPRERDEEAIARIEPELERLHLVEAALPATPPWRVPTTLSVTAFLTFVRDPEEFFWRYVRRVPSPPSPAVQLGIELHRRIELHATGKAPPVAELEYDLDPGEQRGDSNGVSPEQMWENFLASRFATMTPLMTEQPFTLYLGHGISVEGRIDAIFEGDGGVWEVVDYKTGKSDPDPLQLMLYLRAAEEIWARDARAAWLLLRDGRKQELGPLNDSANTIEQAAHDLSAAGTAVFEEQERAHGD